MKKISMLISVSLLFTACSKTVKEVQNRYHDSKTESTFNTSTVKGPSEVELIKKILNAPTPNIALAEILAKTVSPESRSHLLQIVSELSSEEAGNLVKIVLSDYRNIREGYLYHNQNYQNNRFFLENSLVNPKELGDAKFSVDQVLQITVFNSLKNKALADIISTYDKRAMQLGKELAGQIISDLLRSSPQSRKILRDLSKSQSKDKFIKTLQEMKPFVEQVDSYFKNSTINHNEQFTVLMAGAIAGALYESIKEDGDFYAFLRNVKKVAMNLKTITDKANEMMTLVTALDKHVKATEEDISTLNEGLIGIGRDLRFVFNEAKQLSQKESNIHSRRIVDFLHKNIVSGKKTSNGDNSSIFSRPVYISQNVIISVNAAENIANNLSNIIQTANQMAEILGVKFSEDTLKVMKTASKVAAVANAASVAIKGFATGGALGAISALGGSDFGGLGGALGGLDKNTVEFAAINRKLDLILSNQRKMMEMQVETMKMIKELAILVDGYHQKEMMALAELRDYALVNIEFGKARGNEKIRHCERMINFHLSSVWANESFNFNSKFGIHNVNLVSSKLMSNIKSLSDVRKLVKGQGMQSFSNCQSGLADAFSEITSENPVLAVFSTDENNNLYKWQRDSYKPLIGALSFFNGTSDFDTVPLHIPSSNFDGQLLKAQYLKSARLDGGLGSTHYELDHLLSVHSLERFVTRLLILYPVLELDKPLWDRSFEEIVETYLARGNQNTRSFFYLQNALKMVQSAIAQETILAGEPLLGDLRRAFNKEIFSDSDCQTFSGVDLYGGYNQNFICSVRNNKLLMKNLLNYGLAKQKNNYMFHERYQAAFENNDRIALAALLQNHIGPSRLVNKDGQILMKLSGTERGISTAEYLLPLPTPEELLEEKIIYSENMERLLKMQTLVVEALEKVSPKREAREEFLKIFFL